MKVESEITMILPDGRNAHLALHRISMSQGCRDGCCFNWFLKVNGRQVEVAKDRIDGMRMLDAARLTLLATGAKEQEVVC